MRAVEGRTDMTKLIIAFRDFANAPNETISALPSGVVVENSVLPTCQRVICSRQCESGAS